MSTTKEIVADSDTSEMRKNEKRGKDEAADEEERKQQQQPPPSAHPSHSRCENTLAAMARLAQELKDHIRNDPLKTDEAREKAADQIVIGFYKISVLPKVPIRGTASFPEVVVLGWLDFSYEEDKPLPETPRILHHSVQSKLLHLQARNFLTASYNARRAICLLIYHLLCSIPNSLESDPSGYYAAQCLFANSLLTKLVRNTLDVVTQPIEAMNDLFGMCEMTPKEASLVNSSAAIFMTRYHTKCTSCGKTPVVGRALLHPESMICEECVLREISVHPFIETPIKSK